MAQPAAASDAADDVMMINPAHTAGKNLTSDIVLPADLLEPLCHAVNDDGALYALDELFSMGDEFDEDDMDMFDDDGFDDEDDLAAYSQVWVWRKPRLRKA